jgi:hypothetical protein
MNWILIAMSVALEILIWSIIGYVWSRDKKESIINALIIGFVGSFLVNLIMGYLASITLNILFMIAGIVLSLIIVPLISGVFVFGDLRITVYSWISVMVVKFILFFLGITFWAKLS